MLRRNPPRAASKKNFIDKAVQVDESELEEAVDYDKLAIELQAKHEERVRNLNHRQNKLFLLQEEVARMESELLKMAEKERAEKKEAAIARKVRDDTAEGIHEWEMVSFEPREGLSARKRRQHIKLRRLVLKELAKKATERGKK